MWYLIRKKSLHPISYSIRKIYYFIINKWRLEFINNQIYFSENTEHISSCTVDHYDQSDFDRIYVFVLY